jgi:hypothetical protein
MAQKSTRRTPASLGVLLVTAAIGLSACGGFDSAGSGKSVITDFVHKNARKGITIKALTCPSGVKQTVGTSYVCQLTLHNASGAPDQKYNVTVHIVTGNKVEVGRSDVTRTA